MTHDERSAALTFYTTHAYDLIPVHPWNKKIQGNDRGKTPRDTDWVNRVYGPAEPHTWIGCGNNVGVRIRPGQLVIDLDPRNYAGTDCEQSVAALFGCTSFNDLRQAVPMVHTGGGGWHIYCLLPDGVGPSDLTCGSTSLPGVEFRYAGLTVMAAGSRHPNGEYYHWETQGPPELVPDPVLSVIRRQGEQVSTPYSSGYKSLTGAQLTELILDKLPVGNYADNAQWFPVMCGAHHATGGLGVDDFVAWSTSDPRYREDENTIRVRWESLGDELKTTVYTVGTLIRELTANGERTTALKSVLNFARLNASESDEMQASGREGLLLLQASQAAESIEPSDMVDDPAISGTIGVSGSALTAVRDAGPEPSEDEIAQILRLILASAPYERVRAVSDLQARTGLSKGSISEMLKEADKKVAADLGRLLSDKTLEHVFEGGEQLTCPPSGQLYCFQDTHWVPLSDEFLGKLVQRVLHMMQSKMVVKCQEYNLISQAVRLSRITSATLTDRLHSTDLPASVINCRNGELWLARDGSHMLKPHDHKSYLLNCLDVDYNPGAECPLFTRTLREIFERFDDGDEIIRHLGEMLGYTIQPYKNIASWWLFRGPGGDGKSTILKVLGGILGGAQLMSGVKLLALGGVSGYNHAAVSLVGKLSVIIEELPANYLIQDAGVKMLSENTKMEANPKVTKAFDFMYSANLIMCSNGYPATRDLSYAMARRANVIPFNRQFDSSGDEDLDRALHILQSPTEMSGVLNFLLEGLQRLRDRGRFKPPSSCIEAKEEWLGHANNIIRFIRETVQRTNARDCVGPLGDLYDFTYSAWCQEQAIDPSQRKKKLHFKTGLMALGFEVRTGGGNVLKVYGGLLKPDASGSIGGV